MSEDNKQLTKPSEPTEVVPPMVLPKPGSMWRHRNGIVYEVLFHTNTTNYNPKYPPTVVYKSANSGTLWSKPASVWGKSMARMQTSEVVQWRLAQQDKGICIFPVSIVHEALSCIADLTMNEREMSDPSESMEEFKSYKVGLDLAKGTDTVAFYNELFIETKGNCTIVGAVDYNLE